MYRWGSTFTSSHGGYLLEANDKWFASTDVTTGPDGAVYVADWCDQRTAHPDPDAEWDRSNGRIYRIQSKAARPSKSSDLAQLSSDKLIALLESKNDWFVRKARRLLAERHDPKVISPLRKLVLESTDDHLALEALWALYGSGGLEEQLASKLLAHRNPHVRRWTVRLLGDENRVLSRIARGLLALSETETNVSVLGQMASTAKRLPAKDGLPIVRQILLRNGNAQDPPLVPLLLWWAVEQHAISAMEQTLALFASSEAWQTPMVREVILQRLMRRYAG